MPNILVLHGPNLNLLGTRELDTYGQISLGDINNNLTQLGEKLGHTVTTFQSNSEEKLIDKIQACSKDQIDFIIINLAAFTHTSIALRDALLAINKPFVEVHISNLFRREPFRQHSYFSDIAIGVISGLGAEGYPLALRYAHHYLLNSGVSPLWTCEKLKN
jgi:3-dehydroquinate dehydratase-2